MVETDVQSIVETESLLLHICCAPCATEVIHRLENNYDIIGFFYNPNIFPEKEYQKRLIEVQRLSALWHLPLDVGEYDHDRFLEMVKGLEKEPEGGKRCQVCYRMRLEQTAMKAKGNGCQVIATTLTISPHKRAAVINPIGREVCSQYGLRFLEGDWKKRDGFKHSVEISKGLGLYRQDYCGCEFSLRERQHP
ncbi:hypothetical protein CH330_00465 [candidate division WOR-3 bacterium JGI_Cruoil_03_51_56]|uniref:Epoxyqueuosine reductase QueH n=1 Tax=candidate division WOR-3 bacterium JGI_Cruoil_03_51_56 TaxID=1973747 RepID=A0A235BYA3_UNCW3|nr:MAG: hypothetical protein CH330_00465 [candidate division WOR-3 bacterium JGI_Cruoil_03_51_56]